MEDVFSFNGTEYSVEDLNSESKLILEYIFEINTELKSLRKKSAVLQTASKAYSAELTKHLEGKGLEKEK